MGRCGVYVPMDGVRSDAGGGIFDRLLRNRVDPNRKWFQVGKVEQKLYEILKVKKWKILPCIGGGVPLLIKYLIILCV